MMRRMVVSGPDRLRALVSPARQEVLEVMTRMGAVSLAELGAVLGRPADGLYYHVRALERLGLVVLAGTRRKGRHGEALFRAAAAEFVIRYPSTPAGRGRTVTPVVTAMLRLGIRDFRRALADGRVRFDGPDREVWAVRTTGWLSASQLRRVNRLIRELARSTAQRGPARRLYAATVVLAPLVQRNNTTGRRPRVRPK
jgi:hypothetical protein